MIDMGGFPGRTGAAETFYFEGTSPTAGGSWVPFMKPRGKSMIDILLVGKGGNGGSGVIGANSTAAGGGGGGSGAQTRVTMPLAHLPDIIYLSLAGISATTTLLSYISIAPSTVANNVIAIAQGGGNGGNATGATAGTAGTAGTVAAAAGMIYGFGFAQVLAGIAGGVGGTTGAALAVSMPSTGLIVNAGTGGAGLGAAASAGTAGGSQGGLGVFFTLPGGLGTATATVPPGNGSFGVRPITGTLYGYGGTGGGSTHGTATGAGLVQASGGNGAPGCGGGGSGGALTGSTAGVGGQGGPAFCVITVW